MASRARKAFDENRKDVGRLLEIHQDVGGAGPGRRWGTEVLNKSAIVLITAFWEAYCEDIVAEGVHHLVEHAPDAKALPTELQKQLAKELIGEAHDLAVWQLADDGWRQLLLARMEAMREERNRRLNTPKAAQINDLFRAGLGIPKISSTWHWPKLTAAAAAQRLDSFVEMRGTIAHRGSGQKTVLKKDVTAYSDLVNKLVSRTGGQVNSYVRKVTGIPLW